MADENKDEVVVPDLKDKKVKFDEEQIKVVNTLFGEAFKTGAEKAEAKAAAKLKEEKDAAAAEKARLEAEVAALKAKVPEPKKEEKKEETPPAIPNETLEMFKAQMAEMKGIVDTIKTERDQLKTQVDTQAKEQRKAKKKDLFLDAVTKAKVNFFDPLEAYKLAEDDGYEFDAETDRPVIRNKATGSARLNENAEPMSVVDFVKDFAKRKNYLVQAPSAGGTGAGEQRRETPPEEKGEKKIEDMSNEEFEAYRSKVMNKATAR